MGQCDSIDLLGATDTRGICIHSQAHKKDWRQGEHSTFMVQTWRRDQQSSQTKHNTFFCNVPYKTNILGCLGKGRKPCCLQSTGEDPLQLGEENKTQYSRKRGRNMFYLSKSLNITYFWGEAGPLGKTYLQNKGLQCSPKTYAEPEQQRSLSRYLLSIAGQQTLSNKEQQSTPGRRSRA